MMTMSDDSKSSAVATVTDVINVQNRNVCKNVCLTSCQTTSGAPISDLIVAFCTHFIFRKSHERTAPNAEQKFFTDSTPERSFFYPQAQYKG